MPLARVNGVSINYELEGTGPPLVFINGLTMDLNGWAEQAGFFAPRYTVLRYDCRGQGRSTKPAHPYTPGLHAGDLAALLDTLGIRRAHVVGLSNGGMVAQHLAVSSPGVLGALVLVDTCSHVGACLRAVLESWVGAVKAGGNALRFDVSLPLIFSEGFIRRNRVNIAMMREHTVRYNSPSAVINLARGSMEHALGERVGEITSPVLVLHGAEDILIPPSYAHELSGAIPGSRLVIMEGCGHVPHYEFPEGFRDVVMGFLEAHDGLLGEVIES